MRRIAAEPYVAVMTDEHAGRYRSDRELVREPVRLEHPPVDPERAVAVRERSTHPEPALVRSTPVDSARETFAPVHRYDDTIPSEHRRRP